MLAAMRMRSVSRFLCSDAAAAAGWVILLVAIVPLLDYVGRAVLFGLAGTVLLVGSVAVGCERVRMGVFRHVLCTFMAPAVCTYAAFWLMAPEFWAALKEGQFERLAVHWRQWQVLWGLSFFISACVGCLGGLGSAGCRLAAEKG
jgi:hypothetical protein